MSDPDVRIVRAGERTAAQVTSGMQREVAVDADGVWTGVVTMKPNVTSGWHHHGEHTTVAYVLSGVRRLEFGPGGAEVVDAGPGDFVYVAPGVIHRESNPSEEDARTVAFRAGSGAPTVNVDGPQGG